MPKATSRLLILLICNVAFFFSSPPVLLMKYRTTYFFKYCDELSILKPYRFYKGKCAKGRCSHTQGQVSDAGPAAYFKAPHLEELTSKHGEEFMKINFPLRISLAPITSACHLLPLRCVLEPQRTKVTSNADLCCVQCAGLDQSLLK